MRAHLYFEGSTPSRSLGIFSDFELSSGSSRIVKNTEAGYLDRSKIYDKRSNEKHLSHVFMTALKFTKAWDMS